MAAKSVEDYMEELLNQRYAKRVFAIMSTEHEQQFIDLGKKPDYREYEWMKKRMLEIHRAINLAPGEGDKDAEKAKD